MSSCVWWEQAVYLLLSSTTSWNFCMSNICNGWKRSTSSVCTYCRDYPIRSRGPFSEVPRPTWILVESVQAYWSSKSSNVSFTKTWSFCRWSVLCIVHFFQETTTTWPPAMVGCWTLNVCTHWHWYTDCREPKCWIFFRSPTGYGSVGRPETEYFFFLAKCPCEIVLQQTISNTYLQQIHLYQKYVLYVMCNWQNLAIDV